MYTKPKPLLILSWYFYTVNLKKSAENVYKIKIYIKMVNGTVKKGAEYVYKNKIVRMVKSIDMQIISMYYLSSELNLNILCLFIIYVYL